MRLKIDYGFLKYIYIFVLGFFGFSYLGQYLLLDVLKFPFFFVELFFIPLIFKYWYPTFKTFFRKNTIGLTFLFLILLISMVMSVFNTGSFSNLLEYRSVLYLILVFCYVNKNGVDFDLKHIMYVSIFSVLSELIFVLFINDNATLSSMNMLTIATSIILPFMLEKYILGMGMFGLSLVSGITSGYRIGVVVAAVAFFVSVGYMIVRNDKTKSGVTRLKRLTIVGLFVAVAIILVLNYIPIVEFLSEKVGMDSFAVFRVTNRLTTLLEGDFNASQEGQRLDVMALPFEQFWDYWFPLGIDLNLKSLYIDAPTMFFYSVFGSVISWVLYIAIFIKAVTKIPILLRKYDIGIVFSTKRYEAFGILLFPVLLVCFAINGTFFINTYQAIFTGVILGFIYMKNDTIKAEKECVNCREK